MVEEIRFATPRLDFGALAWGPADGPLALCLHGYPDTAWTWRGIAPRLADAGWRVVAPFMRGYAPSDVASDGDYSIAALARDAVECRDALGGDGRAVVIGHDWGAAAVHAIPPGPFARRVALSVPPAPVLLAAFRGSPALAARQALHSWYMGFQQLPLVSEASLPWLIPRLWRRWSPAFEAGEDVARVLAALDGPGRRRAALSYYRALRGLRPSDLQPSDLRPSDLRPSDRRPSGLGRGAGEPLLYLHGRDDGCLLAELVERGRGAFPASARVELVAGAGHFLALEQPERVAEPMLEFMALPHPGY